MSTQVNVQFEVYILQHEQWSVHARYLVTEKEKAIIDAQRIEQGTGLPTKVICNTYYSGEDRSEEITVYSNKKVKTQLEPTTKRSQGNFRMFENDLKLGNGVTASTSISRGFIDGVSFGHLLLTICLSFGIALGLTGLFTILLAVLTSTGTYLTDSAKDQISVYWFFVMFTLSIMALNRKVVTWRYIAARRDPIGNHQMPEDETESGFKPKRPELLRQVEITLAKQELKISRGDIVSKRDTFAQPLYLADTKINCSNKKKVIKENQIKAAKTELIQRKDEDTSIAFESPDTIDADVKYIATPDKTSSNLILAAIRTERLQMISLLGDAILAIRKNQDYLDTETRLGMSLFLAGAAASLAEQRGLGPEEEQDLLSETLRLIGHDENSSDTFFSDLMPMSRYRKNQDLISVGRAAMDHKLRNSRFSVLGLSNIISQWNAPMMTESSSGETFLLTYVKSDDHCTELADEESMDRHTSQVREVFLDYNGAEIQHTGKGVFARFHNADDALAAAISIQQNWQRLKTTTTPPPPASIALISSDSMKSYPTRSNNALSQADTLCRILGSSQIACDVLIRDICTTDSTYFGSKIPMVAYNEAEYIDAVEVKWETAP